MQGQKGQSRRKSKSHNSKERKIKQNRIEGKSYNQSWEWDDRGRGGVKPAFYQFVRSLET